MRMYDIEAKIVLWASIGHFCNHVGNYLTPALLIYLQKDIILNNTERGVLGSIPMVLLVLFSSIVGGIGDKYPILKKHMIWIGMLGIGVFSILMSFANSFFDLAIATVILGISLSTYHPLAFSFLNMMPNKDQNMGINAVSGNFGTAITPFLAMVVAVFWGWREAFLAFSTIQILAGVALALFFPNNKETHIELTNYTKNERLKEKIFSEKQILLLSLILVTISAARAPVFRCISYFTTIVFNDAYSFTEIESSVLTTIILSVGALATFLAGLLNNQKAKRGIGRNERIGFRINTILISSGMASLLLIFLIIIPIKFSLGIIITYLFLAFFFFLGAAVLPTIMSEITGTKGMGSAFGFLFAGATLTGAIAPTIFGYLADTYDFSTSFLFLGIITVICLLLILLFKFIFHSITLEQDSASFP